MKNKLSQQDAEVKLGVPQAALYSPLKQPEMVIAAKDR